MEKKSLSYRNYFIKMKKKNGYEIIEEEFPKNMINPNEHYEKARELYENHPELKGKVLLGLMDGLEHEIKVICGEGYQNDLHVRNAEFGRGNLMESLGVEIKADPRSLK
jgi:hypothetical protein